MTDSETTQPSRTVPENLSQFFSSSEFSRGYLGLQRGNRLKEKLANELYQHYRGIYQPDNGWGEDEAEQHIDYMMSTVNDTDDSDFDYDKDAARLKKLIRDIEDKAGQIQERLLEYGEQVGIGQFASYGLKRYIANYLANKSVLYQVVENVHRDLESFDELVRSNEGKLITIINMGIYACRIGTGGISIHNDHIAIPVADGTKPFGTALGDWPGDQIEQWPPQINTYSVINDANARLNRAPIIFDDWSRLQDITKVINQPGGLTVAFGDVAEGQPILPNDLTPENRQWYSSTFEKLHAVGSAAMNGCVQSQK